MTTYNLKEIAMLFAKKQPKMVEELTEETAFLQLVKWEPASHGLWNMAEKVTDITGAQFVNADAPLPTMNVSSGLVKVDVTVMGGEMEVPVDTSDQFGGAAAYFAKKQPLILKDAGMATEKKLYYDNWLAKAIADGNVVSAGASSGGTYSILVIRMEEGVNCGLFDPTGFAQGTLLTPSPINGGAMYHLRSKTGVLGYGVALKGRFGWQNLSTRNVSAIVNIATSHVPTAAMIDDAIADVRGTPGSTFILCHNRCRTLAISPLKYANLMISVGEKSFNQQIDDWNGIPIIGSYNILDGTETVVTVS